MQCIEHAALGRRKRRKVFETTIALGRRKLRTVFETTIIVHGLMTRGLMPLVPRVHDAHRTGMHCGQARRGLWLSTHDALEGRPRALTLDHAFQFLNSRAGRLKIPVALIKKPLHSVTVIGSRA